EAVHKTQSDRIVADHEDDGECRGRRLGCERRSGTSRRGDHGDLPANQICREARQPIQLVVRIAIFDRHVLALDIADVFEALAESAQAFSQRIAGSSVEKPNRRYCRLLRARRERPRRRAAEERDKLAAAAHSITSSASASSLSGIWRPSVLAVLRLITGSCFTLIDPMQQRHPC